MSSKYGFDGGFGSLGKGSDTKKAIKAQKEMFAQIADGHKKRSNSVVVKPAKPTAGNGLFDNPPTCGGKSFKADWEADDPSL